MSLALAPTQPPPSQVAVVSGGDANQELSNLKVKVRSEVVPRPAKGLGRKQAKILRPLAVSTADDKEVGMDDKIQICKLVFKHIGIL